MMLWSRNRTRFVQIQLTGAVGITYNLIPISQRSLCHYFTIRLHVQEQNDTGFDRSVKLARKAGATHPTSMYCHLNCFISHNLSSTTTGVRHSSGPQLDLKAATTDSHRNTLAGWGASYGRLQPCTG
jgi:hypothetical protein